MSCSIKDMTESGIYNAVNKFVGNATSFKVENNVVRMPVSDKFSKSQLYLIAQKNAERVYAWAEKEYGPAFQYGWIDIDTSVWNNVTVRFRIPPALSKAWQVQDELISIEEANDHLSLPDVGNDFFMGDQLLAEQVNRENSLESEEYDMVFGSEDILKSNQFSYNKLLEVKNSSPVEDDVLKKLSDKLNKC